MWCVLYRHIWQIGAGMQFTGCRGDADECAFMLVVTNEVTHPEDLTSVISGAWLRNISQSRPVSLLPLVGVRSTVHGM